MEKEKLKDYLIKGTTFREIAKLEKISHQIVMKIRRKYNATYRLRKLGVKVNTRAKTIYTPPFLKK